MVRIIFICWSFLKSKFWAIWKTQLGNLQEIAGFREINPKISFTQIFQNNTSTSLIHQRWNSSRKWDSEKYLLRIYYVASSVTTISQSRVLMPFQSTAMTSYTTYRRTERHHCSTLGITAEYDQWYWIAGSSVSFILMAW